MIRRQTPTPRSDIGSGAPSILVVEDDAKIGDLIARYLEMNQFSVTVVDNGVAMDSQLAAREFDLLILDLNLLGENGLSICRRLRNEDKGRLPTYPDRAFCGLCVLDCGNKRMNKLLCVINEFSRLLVSVDL